MLEAIYSYPYENSFNLNKVKSMLFEDEAKSLKLLFHGAKNEIVGTIDSKHLNGKKTLVLVYIYQNHFYRRHLGYANGHTVPCIVFI